MATDHIGGGIPFQKLHRGDFILYSLGFSFVFKLSALGFLVLSQYYFHLPSEVFFLIWGGVCVAQKGNMRKGTPAQPADQLNQT